MVDERLLAEATRLTGAKTYSQALDFALRELIREAKARRILELASTGEWEGDLARMCRDSPRSSGN